MSIQQFTASLLHLCSELLRLLPCYLYKMSSFSARTALLLGEIIAKRFIGVIFKSNFTHLCWVRCYYVPDHYFPVCLKRPLVTTSLDSLRPLIITSLLKSFIWSLRPLYIMSPVWNVPGCLRFLYITSLDHYAPWSQRPLNTMSLEHNVPVVNISLICWPFLHLFQVFFFSELHGLVGHSANPWVGGVLLFVTDHIQG